MTGIAESANAAEPLEIGEVNGSAKATRQTEPRRDAPLRLGAIGG
jgi:hypothetical protein